MPNLLFIDTSGKTATVAVSRTAAPVAVQTLPDAREQAALLNRMIGDVLASAGIVLADLDAICVCAGPGSYTGLRVGLSTAKGLAYAMDKPLMLFNNLDLLAWEHKGESTLDVLLKARENEYFFAQYNEAGTQVTAPKHIFATDRTALYHAGKLLLADDPAVEPADGQELQLVDPAVSIDHWIPEAESRFAAGRFDDLAYSEPFYLKAAYTTQSKK